MTQDTPVAECPHPDCGASINVLATLPAGVYDCRCQACKVKLTWATYIDRGRVPYLSLEQDEPEP